MVILYMLTIFVEKLHHKCLTGFLIHLLKDPRCIFRDALKPKIVQVKKFTFEILRKTRYKCSSVVLNPFLPNVSF